MVSAREGGNYLNFPSLEKVVNGKLATNLRVWFQVFVKKLWLIWKCCGHNLIDILTLGRWELLKNGWWIHTASIWIKSQIMRAERRSQIELHSNRPLEMQSKSKTLSEYWWSAMVVSKTPWNCTSCAQSICNNIPRCRSGFRSTPRQNVEIAW